MYGCLQIGILHSCTSRSLDEFPFESGSSVVKYSDAASSAILLLGLSPFGWSLQL